MFLLLLRDTLANVVALSAWRRELLEAQQMEQQQQQQVQQLLKRSAASKADEKSQDPASVSAMRRERRHIDLFSDLPPFVHSLADKYSAAVIRVSPQSKSLGNRFGNRSKLLEKFSRMA